MSLSAPVIEASTVSVENLLTTASLVVTSSISVKGTADDEKSGAIDAKTVQAESAEVKALSVTGSLSVSNDASFSGSVSSASLSTTGDVSVGQALVASSLSAPTATLETLEVTGQANLLGAVAVASLTSTGSGIFDSVEAKAATLGSVTCQAATFESASSASLDVTGEAVFGATVKVAKGGLEVAEGGVTAVSLAAAEGITSKTLTLSSKLDMPEGDADVRKLTARDATIAGEFLAKTIVAEESIEGGSVTATGLISAQSGFVTDGNVAVAGDCKVKGSVEADKGTFSGVLKADSVMGTRFYVQDVTASGFLSGAVVNSKGDVNALGAVTGGTLESTGSIKGKSMESEGLVKAGTLEVSGPGSVGNLEAKKVVVGGVDVITKITELEATVQALLERLNALEAA